MRFAGCWPASGAAHRSAHCLELQRPCQSTDEPGSTLFFFLQAVGNTAGPPLLVSSIRNPLRCYLQAVSDTAEHDAQSALMAITGLKAGSRFQGRYIMDAGQHRGGASIVSFAKQSQAPFLPVTPCLRRVCSNLPGPASPALPNKTRCLACQSASAVLPTCCMQHCARIMISAALLSRGQVSLLSTGALLSSLDGCSRLPLTSLMQKSA